MYTFLYVIADTVGTADVAVVSKGGAVHQVMGKVSNNLFTIKMKLAEWQVSITKV